MHDAEPTRIKRLLERLLAVRARRDAEVRWSERWHALDAEMHEIERAVFRPSEAEAPTLPDVRMDRAG